MTKDNSYNLPGLDAKQQVVESSQRREEKIQGSQDKQLPKTDVSSQVAEIVSDSGLIAIYAFDNDELETVELYLNDQLILAQKEKIDE